MLKKENWHGSKTVTKPVVIEKPVLLTFVLQYAKGMHKMHEKGPSSQQYMCFLSKDSRHNYDEIKVYTESLFPYFYHLVRLLQFNYVNYFQYIWNRTHHTDITTERVHLKWQYLYVGLYPICLRLRVTREYCAQKIRYTY